MKVIKKLVVMLVLSVFLISVVAATVHAESMTKKDPEIEAKYKVAKVKVTWNANGGKIGSKKTVSASVTKGAKLNKLATAKRSGYTFQGWYTKKSGGKKISKNTKVSKGVTYFAHWKKGSSSVNSKFLGHWRGATAENGYQGYNHYYFYADGRFQFFHAVTNTVKIEGKYSVSNGKVYFKEIKSYRCSLDQQIKDIGLDYPKHTFDGTVTRKDDMTTEYKFSSDGSGVRLKIASLYGNSGTYTLAKITSDAYRKVT
ncbi:MAG: InlB B-repeat-containing protein [Methanobrevibacter sp.]|nr:InlB B-repeat-containing protein [Methanobrevibacter sp.]